MSSPGLGYRVAFSGPMPTSRSPIGIHVPSPDQRTWMIRDSSGSSPRKAATVCGASSSSKRALNSKPPASISSMSRTLIPSRRIGAQVRVRLDRSESREAEPLVERLGARVAVKDAERDRLPRGRASLEQRADDRGAEAASLPLGQEIDAGEVDLIRALLDREQADVRRCDPDDLAVCGVEAFVEERLLLGVVPAPGGVDVLLHRRAVQLEREVAIGVRGGSQRPGRLVYVQTLSR